MAKITSKQYEVLVHELLDALKFCKSVLEANPLEMSQRVAVQKAEIAIGRAAAFRVKP